MRLLYFASVRERMRRSEEHLVLPEGVASVGALAAWLRARDPAGAAAFDPAVAVRAAVNQVFAPPSAPVAEGNEVAFFPPGTGG